MNVDYTNVPTIISNSETIGVKKIYFYTENKRKERNCRTRFLFYPRANSRMITRWSGKEDWQETKFNHPRLLPVEGSEKKKGGKGRETEMNRFGHGGRQKRLIIGQVRVKVENLSAARPLESIVRKVSCDTTIPVGRGERLSEKKEKEKKKGDARDKKNRFPARNQTIHRVSIPRTLWRNEQQDPVDRQKIVARFPLFYLWRRSDAFSKPV